MGENPFVSIIVAAYKDSELVKNFVRKNLELDYDNFEVLVVADKPIDFGSEKFKVIFTGKNDSPAAFKRNLGAKKAKGEILAFVDDDAYPRKDWLKNAVPLFSEKIGAVCGPAVTPIEDSFLEKASGAIWSSWIAVGPLSFRCRPEKERLIDDYITCNLLVKKIVFEKVNGFNFSFFPGEDVKFCAEIVEKGHNILYSPDVVVFHHRRALFVPHLRQIAVFANCRGFFARNFEKTSLRLIFLVPLLFVLFVFFGAILSFFNETFRLAFSVSMLAYFLAVFLFLDATSLRQRAIATIGTFFTHLVYGVNLFLGFFWGLKK